MSPSKNLLAALDQHAYTLIAQAEQGAQQHIASAADLDVKADAASVLHMSDVADHAADEAALVTIQKRMAERALTMSDRAQQIEDHRAQAAEHRGHAEQMRADVEYLKQRVQPTETEPPAQQSSLSLPSGVVAATGPQMAIPATPAEMAATQAMAGDTPRCMNCGNPIHQDSLGWAHAGTRSEYCTEGSAASVLRVPAALEVHP